MIVAELFATLGLVTDEGSFVAGEQLVEKLGHVIEAYLSYEALKSVFEMFKGVAEAADQAAKASQRTGLAVETFQELDHAAAMSDTSIGSVTNGLDKLEKGMEKFSKTGKGPVGDALGKLHISLAALKHDTPEQRLERIASAMAKLPAGADKAQLAMQLFGGAGKSMIPLLNAGAEGIEQMRNEAHDLGLVIDEDVAHKFEEFNDQQHRVGDWFQGFKNQIAVALLPVLSEIVDHFYEWLQANREWIEQGVDTVVNALITGFHWLTETIAEGIEFLKKHKEYLVAIGLVIAGIIVPAVVSWAAATLVAMAPWIALGAAVALVAYWIKEIWDDSGGQAYTMAEVWSAVQQAAEEFGTWLSQLPENARTWINDTGEAIKSAMKDAWDAVVSGVKAAWDAIVNTIKEAWESIKHIPIVGHVIRGGAFVVRHLTEGPGVTDQIIAAQKLIDQTANGTVTVPVPSGLPFPVMAYTGGDVHVTVNAANMTPEQVEKHVTGAVREAQTDAIRQAHASLGGGKRQ